MLTAQYLYRIRDFVPNLKTTIFQEFGKHSVTQCVFTDWTLCTNWSPLTVPGPVVSPGSSQPANWLKYVRPKNAQYFTTFQSVHRQKKWNLFLFPILLKLHTFLNMGCSYFPLNLGRISLSGSLSKGQLLIFSWPKKKRVQRNMLSPRCPQPYR